MSVPSEPAVASAPTPRQAADGDPTRAIVYAVCAVGMFAIQDAFVKLLVADYPTMQILGVRSLVMLIPAAILLRAEGGLHRLRSRQPRGHALRGFLTLATWITFYFAIGRLPLGDMAAIFFSAPLMITALSGPLLGERVGAHRWTALLIGFLGVLLIARPSSDATGNWAGIVALVSSLFYALMMIQTRRLTRTESSAAMLVYSAMFMTLVSIVTWPFQWVTPGSFDTMLLVALGLLGGISHYIMIQAYRLAPVYVVAPFEYTHLVWAMVLGYLIWAELPGMAMLVGAAVIVGSGLYVLAREARFARRAAQMRATSPSDTQRISDSGP